MGGGGGVALTVLVAHCLSVTNVDVSVDVRF